MAERVELHDLVHPGDALAAVKILLGSRAELLNYEVHKGTETVQGLMSMILRVVAKCRDGRGNSVECRFIVKRQPALQAQVDAVNEMELFLVEAEFFKKCAPILLKRSPDLSLVRCIIARNEVLVFEDLGEQNFRTLSPNFTDLLGTVVNLQQVRMLFRQLAKFHAASLDVDWRKVAPQCFQKDVLFEVNDGKAYRTMMENSIKRHVAPLLRHFFSEEKIEAHIDWLCSPKMWEKFVSFVKPNNRYVNVICHGDFWVNNVMFKLAGEEPVDVRLIDMQTVRFGPQLTDLQYFLYLCTKQRFRAAHEHEVLRTYLEAFNAAANRTPDPTTWHEFLQAYEETRLFGALNGLSMAPIVFAGDVAPESGDELTTEHFENLMQGGKDAWDAVAAFETNAVFRDEMQPLLQEVVREMDKLGCIHEDQNDN